MKKIEVTKFCVKSNKIPEGFNGCRILQVSDLHGNVFGKNQSDLIEVSKRLRPDFIFITGDLIDERCRNLESIYTYIQEMKDVAPIYYVTGNHEWTSKVRKPLLSFLQRSGVHILQDTMNEINRNGEKIQLIGMDDPYCLSGMKTFSYDRAATKAFLERFISVIHNKKTDCFTILLSHRPELIHFYMKAGIDLVFAGHAHGGQFRIEGKGGLLAPHQGFFPKYTEGLNCQGHTQMIVSRGLGNSGFPVRIGNSYELVLAYLKREM